MATPPDFSVGQVLTAAQMNAVGLWLVKEQTIGSAVSSVTVTDAFNADFEKYLLTVNGGTTSAANGDLRIKIGAAVTGYYYSIIYSGYTSSLNQVFSLQAANTTIFPYAGTFTSDGLQLHCEITNPYLTKRTFVQCLYVSANTTGSAGTFQGFLNTATSYTDLTISCNTGTMTGGTIRVYGYRS